MTFVPVSAVIATKDRPAALARALRSLLASTAVPAEFVIVDASADPGAARAIHAIFDTLRECPRIIVQSAATTGAAAQRNQAVALAGQDYVLFCDDDIICQPDCIERLWNAVRADATIGGASAAIVNQSYARPGFLMRAAVTILGEPEGEGYAGRIVGPAIAFLPQLPAADAAAPDTVPVQWLNTTCVLYRRQAMPDPPFDPFFRGYSIGEDIALSLRVARKARLVNVPGARIHHDSQPGAHKAQGVARSRMEIVNRHCIMTRVMGKGRWSDAARMVLWEGCQLAICAVQQRGGVLFWRALWGKLLGLRDIAQRRR